MNWGDADMQDRPLAVALEDEDPLVYVGEQALAPPDTGREPDPADRNPPAGLTPEKEEEEEASASVEDGQVSKEVPEQ
jgi:hypothetical protein